MWLSQSSKDGGLAFSTYVIVEVIKQWKRKIKVCSLDILMILKQISFMQAYLDIILCPMMFTNAAIISIDCQGTNVVS